MANPLRLIGLLSLAGLLGWTVWEARWTPQPLPPPEIDTGTAPAPDAPPASAAPLSDYPVTLERPLFFPGRRPASDGTASAAPDGPAGAAPSARLAPRLTLTAVIEEHGQRSALLSLPGQAVSSRLREGERIGDWRLIRIDSDRVTVETDGRREDIPLRNYGAAQPPLPVKPRPPLRRPQPAAGAEVPRPPE